MSIRFWTRQNITLKQVLLNTGDSNSQATPTHCINRNLNNFASTRCVECHSKLILFRTCPCEKANKSHVERHIQNDDQCLQCNFDLFNRLISLTDQDQIFNDNLSQGVGFNSLKSFNPQSCQQ